MYDVQTFCFYMLIEGLKIDELKKWPGPMNGLTFHCWLRLDNVSFHHCSNTFGLASYRRQLLQYGVIYY